MEILRETHIVLGHGGGVKPINFGSHKAEGSETNTVFGYRGGGHIMLFKVEGSETHILLAHI